MFVSECMYMYQGFCSIQLCGGIRKRFERVFLGNSWTVRTRKDSEIRSQRLDIGTHTSWYKSITIIIIITETVSDSGI